MEATSSTVHSSLMSLPPELVLRIVNEVVNADVYMVLDTYMDGKTPLMASICLAHCNRFMQIEVPKRYLERASGFGNMRWGEYMSVEESIRWEWEDQWRDFRSGKIS